MILGEEYIMKRCARMITCLLLVSVLLAASIPAYALPSTLRLMKCTVDGGRVRKAPGSSNAIVASLRKGETVLYAGVSTKTHYCVCTSSGKIGYIYKNFLSYYGSVRTDQIYYSPKAVNYYSNATSKAKKLGSFQKYELVIVYQIVGGIGYAKNLKGKGGYISMSGMHRRA